MVDAAELVDVSTDIPSLNVERSTDVDLPE